VGQPGRSAKSKSSAEEATSTERARAEISRWTFQVEPAVMNQKSRDADLHAFIKIRNYVTGFSFPYLDIEGHQFLRAPTFADEKLTFDPRTKGQSPRRHRPRPHRPCRQYRARQLILGKQSKENAAGAAPAPERTPRTADNNRQRRDEPQDNLDFITTKRRICSPSQKPSARPRRRPTTPKSSRPASKNYGGRRRASSASGQGKLARATSALPERVCAQHFAR